jgi:hypothetical protein
MLRAGKHALQACEWSEGGDAPNAPEVIDAALESEATAAKWQQWTFVVSLILQVGVLIFSWVSIWQYDVPYLLFVAMMIEAIVQTVEFIAYLVIGLVAWLRRTSVGVEWRYFDWALTTPTMLISLFMLVQYFWRPCESDQLQQDRFIDVLSFVLPIVLVSDWAMLATGFVVEYDTSRAVKRLGARVVEAYCGAGPPDAEPKPILDSPLQWFPVILFAYLNPLTWRIVCPGVFGAEEWLPRARSKSLAAQSVSYRMWYLAFGFAFLAFAFALHLFSIGGRRPSSEGAALTLITLVVWMIYGAVAIWFTPRGDLNPQSLSDAPVTYVKATTTLMWKNVWYNVLDLVSKNSTGILVSIVAANYDAEKLGCGG